MSLLSPILPLSCKKFLHGRFHHSGIYHPACPFEGLCGTGASRWPVQHSEPRAGRGGNHWLCSEAFRSSPHRPQNLGADTNGRGNRRTDRCVSIWPAGSLMAALRYYICDWECPGLVLSFLKQKWLFHLLSNYMQFLVTSDRQLIQID